MNHLAHFHLSGRCPGRIAGALLADHVRGAVDRSLPASIAAGIRLHRQVDAFTDAHPALRALRRLFPSPERRFSGIAIDIAFDRVLTRHWTRYSTESLPDFCVRVHGALAQHAGSLGEAARRHAEGMERHAALARYAEEGFAQGAFLRVCSPLAGAECAGRTWQLTVALGSRVEEAFLQIYPQARALAERVEREALSAGS